jgi:hypothetical protein
MRRRRHRLRELVRGLDGDVAPFVDLDDEDAPALIDPVIGEPEPTAKSVAADRDAAPALILIAKLERYEHFRAAADRLRRGELGELSVDRIVRDYGGDRPDARCAFARVMGDLAAGINPFPPITCFPDAPLEDGDPKRALQKRKGDRLIEAADMILRQVAGQCRRCGERLPSPRGRNLATGRSYRRLYCPKHENPGRKGRSQRELDDAAIQELLDAFVSVKLGKPSRIRARRAKRRK